MSIQTATWSIQKKNTITHDGIEKLLNSLNNAEYYIDSLAIEHIDNGLFVPFKELTAIKKQIVFTLNGSKARISPVEMPVLKKNKANVRQSRRCQC